MKKPVAIPVEKLRPFAGHPFKVRDDDEMNTLIESIQTQGILSPLIVRPIENTEEYEVVSGHRRLHAAQKAGITEVPALIYALDRDSAAIAVVDSNLHREHILPSEKAFAYKLKMEALLPGSRTHIFRCHFISENFAGQICEIAGDRPLKAIFNCYAGYFRLKLRKHRKGHIADFVSVRIAVGYANDPICLIFHYFVLLTFHPDYADGLRIYGNTHRL